MYVLDMLNGWTPDKPEDGFVTFEYRLLCSGELYNSRVVSTDWRKARPCSVQEQLKWKSTGMERGLFASFSVRHDIIKE
jgi:hypothetical protein